MTFKKSSAGLLGAAALAAVAVVPIVAQAATPQRDCFFSNQWRGWNSPDPNTLYLRVGLKDVYRVDLVGNRTRLRPNGDRFLVSEVRGSGSICSATDLDLSVSDHHGFKTPLFPRSLTKMSPEEVQAIPRGFRP